MQHKPHKFDKPPAAQAARGDLICIHCGARRSVVGPDSECTGRHSDAITEVIHDYNPID